MNKRNFFQKTIDRGSLKDILYIPPKFILILRIQQDKNHEICHRT